MIIPESARHAFVELPRVAKQLLAVFLDAAILFAAFHLALWFRFELFFLNEQYLYLSILGSLGGVAALGMFGVYFYVLRYMSERIAVALIAGVAVSVAVITAGNTFLYLAAGISRAVLLIYASLALIGLISVRLLARRLLFPKNMLLLDPRIPIIVYGAGTAGSQVATALRAGPHYQLVGMIDDDQRKHRLVVAGLRVYPRSALPELVERYKVQQLLIAIPSANPARIREIVEFVEPYKLRIRLVPGLKELVDSSDGVRLRDVQVEDLLGRDPVAPIPELLGRCVTDRVVMVTGAGGSIGSELCRQILELRPRKLVMLEFSEPALYTIDHEISARARDTGIEVVSVLGSIRSAECCLRQLSTHCVETVYHAAAYKHVPIVEANIAEGFLTNSIGTRTLADAAIKAGVRDFVLISTDKAVRPTNVMGATKRLAELVLQAAAQCQHQTRFSMVRFGNVLGSSGSVVPLFRQQILNGGPITLTHVDITRYFMTIPEAAQLVLQAGAMGASGSVFVLDMGEPVRIHDLAVRMIRLFGLTVKDKQNPAGDIEIRISGLRPGEKLYEELLIGENVTETQHPRIMSANEACLEPAELDGLLAELEMAAQANDEELLLSILKKAVPEYAPSRH